MRIRGLVSLAIAAILVSACVRVAGHDQPTETNGAEPATKWTPPRTPDGQPDIQGIWTNYTNTPFEVFDEKDQPGLYSGDPDGTGRGTGPGFINDSFERKLSKGRSLVVDPPSGRVPIMPWAEEKRKKDQKREEKVLAKLREICLGLPQAREVKTWRPTCRRSRVTKRRGAKARRQCRQGIRKCIRLSRTNGEISGGTADSGTVTTRAVLPRCSIVEQLPGENHRRLLTLSPQPRSAESRVRVM